MPKARNQNPPQGPTEIPEAELDQASGGRRSRIDFEPPPPVPPNPLPLPYPN
jgi:hypothetical protein